MSHNAVWQDSATCAQTDPELFFPQLEPEENRGRLSSARKVCRSCIVKLECLNDAIRQHDSGGVRAGLAGTTLYKIVQRGVPLDQEQLKYLTDRYCDRKFQRQRPPVVSAP